MRFALLTAAAILLAVTLGSFFGQIYWLVDLASHFRLQYSFSGLLLAVIAAFVARRLLVFVVLAASMGINLAVLAPLYFGPAAESPAQTIRVLSMNVRRSNPDHARMIDYLREVDADLVLILELDDPWLASLKQLSPKYEFIFAEPRSHFFGIGLLSRIPVKSVKPRVFAAEWNLSVEAELELAGRTVTLIGTHAIPPVGRNATVERDRQLELIAELARTSTQPVVVMGDFNATPFSAPFRAMLDDSPLKNSQRGFGYQASWPKGRGALAFFAIPIDHLLHTPELIIVDRKIEPDAGSDHTPVLITLGCCASE